MDDKRGSILLLDKGLKWQSSLNDHQVEEKEEDNISEDGSISSKESVENLKFSTSVKKQHVSKKQKILEIIDDDPEERNRTSSHEIGITS